MANPQTFALNHRDWLADLSLRTCSMAARGFWIDLLCLMRKGDGHLLVHGKPPSDAQLARMFGQPLELVQGWLRELGDAGMYSVSDDDVMFYPPFVADADPVRSAALKEAWRRRKAVLPPTTATEPQETPLQAAPSPKPRATPTPWYATPAGWARKGGEAALSIGPTETLEDFQVRVSVRIPPGPHLDALSEWQRKAIADKIPKMG